MLKNIFDGIKSLFFEKEKIKEDKHIKIERQKKSGANLESGATSVSDDKFQKSKNNFNARKQKQTWGIKNFVVPPVEGKIRFHDFKLPNELMHAISDLNFRFCTPIQADVLKFTLDGRDAAGQAQTGTGKTAAFLITIINHIVRNPLPRKNRNGTPRALIMAPTRELALQIASDAQSLTKYINIKILAIIGGVHYKKQQYQLKSEKVDIVIATPGRLLDYKNQKLIDLRKVEILVIDEADRMLDMGFIPDMKKIIRATPFKEKRQTLLFSATLPPDIRNLAENWTKNAQFIEISPENLASDSIKQIVFISTEHEKLKLLYNLIVRDELKRVIIFCNRKDVTRKVGSILNRAGIKTSILTGDLDQRKRLKTLENFKSGKIIALTATDVASRGLHIEGISHVINYNMPYDPEDYVHRIGRTGRAGSKGISVSFAAEDDSFSIPEIEKLLGEKFEYSYPDEELLKPLPPLRKVERSTSRKKSYKSREKKYRGKK